MGQLQRLAWEVGAPERTLRRAASSGALNCRRPTPRRLEIDADERSYLRDHWSLLADLRAVLRTEPNVRFAAIFGSLARGDEGAGSDLDVVIEFKARDRRGRIRLTDKLRSASGRDVQMLHLRDVEECAPDLLSEIVQEGRVLVDRHDRWAGLTKRRAQILRRAIEFDESLQAAESQAIAKFEREAGLGVMAEASGASPGRSVLRKRLSQRFTLIEANHADLKESIRRHYPDRDSFVEDWSSTEFEAQERIAALERFYERIVNSLNQIVDDTERALGKEGKLPKLAIAKPGEEPGRWQRLAGYGALSVEHVEPMRRLIGRRNLFQKEYDTLGPEAGADVFDGAKEFSRLLPKVIPAIRDWVDSAIE